MTCRQSLGLYQGARLFRHDYSQEIRRAWILYAYAHSQIVTKLSTRCSAQSVSVMVPNSLGPAELLLHYGTEEQKSHYRLVSPRGLKFPRLRLPVRGLVPMRRPFQTAPQFVRGFGRVKKCSACALPGISATLLWHRFVRFSALPFGSMIRTACWVGKKISG